MFSFSSYITTRASFPFGSSERADVLYERVKDHKAVIFFWGKGGATKDPHDESYTLIAKLL